MTPEVMVDGAAVVFTIGYWEVMVLAGSFIGTSATVVFGVWLNNRDLRKTVGHLDMTVTKLNTTVQHLQINQAVLSGLEERVARLEDRMMQGDK